MRILFCCEYYYPSCGGVQKVMQEVAERLVKHGHDVTVATSKIPKRKFRKLNGVNIEEFKISGNLVYGIKGEIENYRNFVIKGCFDAILVKAAQQWTFDGLWEILHQAKSRKIHIPCGYSCLYENKYHEYYKQMPDILRQFDHLIFYASDYRDINFAKQHSIRHYSIVPNGASEIEFDCLPDWSFRENFNIPKDAFVFMTLGTPVFMKGHMEVAQAYASLKLDCPTVLLLNGNYHRIDNPFAQTLITKGARFIKNMVKTLLERPVVKGNERLYAAIKSIQEQPNKKVLIANLSRRQLISAFFESDLFVFASHIEYSPLVLFEAAAAALPFLTAPVGNSEEIAKWTGAGQICPADKDQRGYVQVDTNTLAKHMALLAKNPELLRDMAQQGRNNWQTKFTWEKIACQYEKILKGNVS